MKKLVFTALAVVAFSGVSMANSLSNYESKETNEFELLYEEDCNVWAMNMAEEMIGWEDTDDIHAFTVYRDLVAYCEGQ